MIVIHIILKCNGARYVAPRIECRAQTSLARIVDGTLELPTAWETRSASDGFPDRHLCPDCAEKEPR